MRTLAAILILLASSAPCWGQLPEGDARPNLAAAARVLSKRPAPVEETGWTWGRTVQWYPGCGGGVRPHLLAGTPQLGAVFRVLYHLWSLPREDGVYDAAGAWVIVALAPPRNEEEPVHVFPSGCSLLFDIGAPTTLVWGFQGSGGYRDALVSREPNGRVVELQVAIPDDRSFAGMRFWTQLLVADRAELKTSQLLEVIFGDPLSARPVDPAVPRAR